MMDATDRHCRFFMRQLTRHAMLYTEMVSTASVLHREGDALLDFDPGEQPVALQLGGSDPAQMAQCAAIAEDMGYVEVNINVGCPSERVRNARFGACLMAEPSLVAECVAAMRARTRLPVSVKTRIGIDEQDSYEHLAHFVQTVHAGGCSTFIVHARKAWLSGLSPRQNREIPPLRYEVVYRLAREHPDLEIVINGGITTLAQCQQHLQHVHGVMLGREPYRNPYLLAEVDHELFGASDDPPAREAVVEAMVSYAAERLRSGDTPQRIARHMLGLYQHQPGARAWRRHLSERANRPGSGAEVLSDALYAMNVHPSRRLVA